MNPVLGGVVVEREPLVQIVGDFGDRLGKFPAIGGLEPLYRVDGVRFILGVPDLSERFLRAQVRRIRQRGGQINGDVVKLMQT